MPLRTNTAQQYEVGDMLTDLLVRVAEAEDVALATLYDTTASLVLGLALRIVGDRQSAEEVTLDVYLQVWRQAASYDPARGNPLAWLLMITRSRAIDRIRARARVRLELVPSHEAATVPDDASGPEEDASIAERRRIINEALTKLGRDERRAIELAYFGGLSHSQIASQLSTPLGTVKTRIRVGMKHLRKHLAGRGRMLP